MIQGYFRTFRAIASQQNIRFIKQQFFIPQRSLNLNYIPICKFGDKKKQDYIVSEQAGIALFNQNMTFNEVSKEWQEEILDQIENFNKANDYEQTITIIANIQSFFQIYLIYWLKESEQLISIDKNIFDFSELILPQLINQEKDYLEQMLLKSFEIRFKFLKYFDSMNDAETIQLLQLYQDLHQKALEILPVNSVQQRISSYCDVEALSVYVAMQWEKNNDEQKYTDQIIQNLRYALVQIQKLLEESCDFEEDEIKLERFRFYMKRIGDIIIENGFIGDWDKNGINFLFEFFNKNERIIEKFKNVLTIAEYKKQKLQNCFYLMQLGYNEEALKNALSISELRFQNDANQIGQYQMLYYCFKKTSNTTYNLEELIKEIKNTKQDSDDYNQLILLLELDQLIQKEKYNQLTPIIEQLINPKGSTFSKVMILELFIDTIINHPKIPNRLAYSEQVAIYLSTSSNYPLHSGNYCEKKRLLYSLILSLIANVVKNEKKSALLASCINHLFRTCQSDNLMKEGVNLILKIIPQIESPKTFKLLTEIIDPLIFQLQKDQQENKKWIELLNSQKVKLRQKYYKEQK